MPTRDEAWPTGTPNWVDLQVADVPAARTYYSELFGWEIFDGPADSGGYLMALKNGRPAAGIGPKDAADPTPSVWSTYFSSADVDATVERVREAGGTVFAEPFDVMTSGRMAVVADASGAVFGLWQAGEHTGAGIYNEPGSYTWNELHTRDLDAARRFYGAVFGFDFEDISNEDFTYVLFKLAGEEDSIGGLHLDGQLPDGMPNYWLSWFAVTSADESTAKAAELGGTVLMGPMDSDFGRMSILQGAQGEVFGIIENPQGQQG